MVTERRQSPRCKPFGSVYLNLASDNGGIVIDASEDGLQFQAVAPVEHDDGPMPVWFTLNPANRIETVGEVVWTDETKKTGGLRFTNLEGESRLQIRKRLELNGSPLPVRVYTSPIDLALSESAVVEEPEHQQETAPIRKPRAAEIEEVLNRVESENMTSAAATTAFVPRYPQRVPLYPEPRPEITETEPPAISILETAHPVEPAPVIPLRVPRGSEPGSTVNTREAASEPPAIFIREMIHPVESAPVIPQRVPPPPFSTIKEEPVVSRSLSFETAAPAPITRDTNRRKYCARLPRRQSIGSTTIRLCNITVSLSGIFPRRSRIQACPSVLSKISREPEFRFELRTTRRRGGPHLHPVRRQSGARESASCRTPVPRRRPSDIVRDVEIMIVVFGLVVAAGAALLIFHRQVGEGVQSVRQNMSSKNTEVVGSSSPPTRAAAGLNAKSLAQPPPVIKRWHPSSRSAGRSPSLKWEECSGRPFTPPIPMRHLPCLRCRMTRVKRNWRARCNICGAIAARPKQTSG